jgi:hypothetical protein
MISLIGDAPHGISLFRHTRCSIINNYNAYMKAVLIADLCSTLTAETSGSMIYRSSY